MLKPPTMNFIVIHYEVFFRAAEVFFRAATSLINFWVVFFVITTGATSGRKGPLKAGNFTNFAVLTTFLATLGNTTV